MHNFLKNLQIRRSGPVIYSKISIIGGACGKTTGVFTSIAAYPYSTNTMEMMGIGFVLHLITGMPFFLGTLIGAVIVIIYTWTLVAYSVTALAVLCEPAFFQRMFAAASPNEIKRGFAMGVPMWLSFD